MGEEPVPLCISACRYCSEREAAGAKAERGLTRQEVWEEGAFKSVAAQSKALPSEQQTPASTACTELSAYAILYVAGTIEGYRIHMQKSPQGGSLGGFSCSLVAGRELLPRPVAFHSLVKPFAKVVADYSCRDGEKER